MKTVDILKRQLRRAIEDEEACMDALAASRQAHPVNEAGWTRRLEELELELACATQVRINCERLLDKAEQLAEERAA